MIIGLFLIGGWFIRLMADVFDKTIDLGWRQHAIFFLIALVFYAIQALLNLETELTNKFSVAIYMLVLAAIGYAPGHVWNKWNSFFQKKASEKLQ